MITDYVIVGSGLTGAVLARLLTDAGRSVIVLDRRSHVGGNVHDHTHESGIRVHTYGPHYFRTNSDAIWEFVNRFASFFKYEARIRTFVDGQFEHWPVTAEYIHRLLGDEWVPAFSGEATNFEEASLSMMPQAIYEKFVKCYSQKQWGVEPRMLSADLARRFDVREDNETRLCRHKHQGIPVDGYASFTSRMLDGIDVVTDCDYLQNRDAYDFRKKLIFTGPIDEFFDFDFGKLKYRGQERRHEFREEKDFVQPCGQVNYPHPADGPHIRCLEWKHMMPPDSIEEISGTLLTREITVTPVDPNRFEYPFPDQPNAALYAKYRERASTLPNVLVCGRLGEYRYYDMDQAIARAFVLGRKSLGLTVRELEDDALVPRK